MKVFLYDTETSNLPEWGKPSDHPDQPHICQFTGVIFDSNTFEELEYVDLIIRQEWPVGPKAFAVHKITPEHSHEVGVPEHHAVQFYEAMVDAADRIAGFSLAFDQRIMRIAMLRTGRGKPYCDALELKMKPRCYDVMHVCTPIAKVPPSAKMMAAGRKTWKSPTLVEAVKAILGEDMSDAHDSRGDLLATMRLYQHLNPSTARK